MKKVSYRHFLSKVLGLSLLLSPMAFHAQEGAVAAQEEVTAAAADDAGGDPVKGKQLFNQNCAACHSLDRKMTGPALANVEERLLADEGLDKAWIHAWVRNSPKMIAEGDPYGVQVYNEYNKAAMTPFPTLSDQDIDDILAYTAAPAAAPVASASPTATPGGTSDSGGGFSNELVLGA